VSTPPQPALVGRLLTALDAAMPNQLAVVLAEVLGADAGVGSASLLLADYDLLTLRRLAGPQLDVVESVPIDADGPGQAFVIQAPVVTPLDDDVRICVPVSVRAERMGVLEVLAADAGTELVSLLLEVGILLGYLLSTAGQYSDLLERARRERPLVLSAELQWSMLPVRAYAGQRFSVAGQLVPAYEVGGDLFDYAVGSSNVQVTSLDAMGHGLNASLLSALAVSALRNARRTGLSLVDQLRFMDKLLWGQFGGEQFVTALSLLLDLDSGVVAVANAGHPDLLRLRAGRVTPLGLEPQLPLGMFPAVRYEQQSLAVQPGDRLVLVSDGVLEAAPAHRPAVEEFGESRLAGALLATATLPPGEAVRHVVRLVRDYQEDDLRDDATVICLDWHG
jgi:serine phosphatase RsbU (regulator of sigma subunit)